MTGDTEQSFLEDRISFVPEGKGCANILMGVAVSCKTVFALQVSYGEMGNNTQRYARERD